MNEEVEKAYQKIVSLVKIETGAYISPWRDDEAKFILTELFTQGRERGIEECAAHCEDEDNPMRSPWLAGELRQLKDLRDCLDQLEPKIRRMI